MIRLTVPRSSTAPPRSSSLCTAQWSRRARRTPTPMSSSTLLRSAGAHRSHAALRSAHASAQCFPVVDGGARAAHHPHCRHHRRGCASLPPPIRHLTSTVGIPERETKRLIAYARAHNKVIIGPATVGGIQAGAFKIADTAGTPDNIISSKLYRPGSVGFVSKVLPLPSHAHSSLPQYSPITQHHN